MNNYAIKKLEDDLWESADNLRANSKLTSNEYCMPVLALLFLRYAYGRFIRVKNEIESDPNRPRRHGVSLPVEAKDFASKSAIFLPEEAQYSYLVNLPDGKDIGEAVNTAMKLVEEQNEKLSGILPQNYNNFDATLLRELVRLFNNDALDDVGGDVMGRIYEYFLNKFAKNIASDDGVFFTPKSLVKMIVNIIEPLKGILLDPACGSGGMFVQSGDFVNSKGMNANQNLTFYGQEKVDYNAKLCLMNIAVHGLNGDVKSGDEANSFYHDAHNLNGKCDYVMANPPFNVDKVKSETAEGAGRLPFGMPGVNKAKEVGNANYLWVNYFYSYLKETGRAGFVMASSATDSQGKDKEIREKLIKTGHVDVMVSVGNNFFYSVTLPCSLWFFDKSKADGIKDKVLFLDARNYYTVVDRKTNEWTENQLNNLKAIVSLYRGEKSKYEEVINAYHEEFASYPKCNNELEGHSYDEGFETVITNLEALLEEQQIQSKKEIAQAELNAKNLKEALKKAKTKEEKDNLKANAGETNKKEVEENWNQKMDSTRELIVHAKDAHWLYSKFGNGNYQDIPGLCKIASISDIEEKGWSLTPGAYVGVAETETEDENFEDRMKEIHRELAGLNDESNKLMQIILNNAKTLGLGE